MCIPSGSIREQDPLKQGLKHFVRNISHVNDDIREQDPLKQGLKRYDVAAKLGQEIIFVSKIH